jgi:hypothetical protein
MRLMREKKEIGLDVFRSDQADAMVMAAAVSEAHNTSHHGNQLKYCLCMLLHVVEVVDIGAKRWRNDSDTHEVE